uniref:Reverse transcriptase domain-containing protein n=1 Tax=Kryptolebias marmoratus TaxID=37003 RepID=A0A3Q3AUI9_KRYMA
MKKGKSPGWDGVPPELYLAFWDILGPPLLDMINKAVDKGSFNPSINTAIITLLLKPNKDPAQCSNYRPLSLLNGDVKLYAKVLAMRLESHLSRLIHNDQTGFIKGRFTSDNLRRLLHIIHETKTTDSPCSVLSLDAEKAFDRLEWPYLWATLDNFKLGPQFIKLIKVLYANPSAMVYTGNTCSSLFPILRGTRQGCPLSPLLFALSLEPLAQKIRQHPSVLPILVKGTEHRISLYADDILLYIGDTGSSLTHLLSVFDLFGSISGYKINWSKSSLLHLGSIIPTSPLPSSIPVVSHFKYLGIDISPSIFHIASHNFQRAFNLIEKDLQRWSKLPNSLQARVSIIKMDILPRVNFYSSMIPLAPPRGYWDRLHSLISKFIYNGKKPRLKLRTLQRDKTLGGLGLPNFKMYFWSFMLRPLLVWLNPEVSVSWKPIEENISKPYRLEDLIYSKIPPNEAKSQLGPIISSLLRTCHSVLNLTNTNLKWHKHSPIFNNFSILIGNKPFSFPRWRDKGVNVLQDLMNNDGLRSFSDLQSAYSLPGSTFFFYLQLRSAMKAYGVPWGGPLPIHPLQELLASQGQTRGIVSKLYKFISDPRARLPVENIWERDLSFMGDIEICWDTVWENLHNTSKNPDHQLIHFKFIHRMYLTPRKRHAMKIITSPICDLCTLKVPGSFMHMYWDCPSVASFWRQISTTLSDLLKFDISLSPSLFLLNDDSTLELSSQQKRMLWAGLTAAKKMLALRWQPPHLLPWQQWANSFLDIVMMERSVARMHTASQKTIRAWDAAYSLIKERVQHNAI